MYTEVTTISYFMVGNATHSNGFGRLTWEWTQLDTERGLSTASKTDGGQFVGRGYGAEVIYSGSDQGDDFRDDKTQQAEMGEQRSDRVGHQRRMKTCRAGTFAHLTLWIEDLLQPNLRWWRKDKPRLCQWHCWQTMSFMNLLFTGI